MDWTVAYFQHQASRWRRLRTEMVGRNGKARRQEEGLLESANSGPEEGKERSISTDVHRDIRGHECYAWRQETMWQKFVELATDSFNGVKPIE